MGLYNRLGETEQVINEGKKEAEAEVTNNAIFSSAAWRTQARNVLKMKQGETIWGKGYSSDVSQMQGTTPFGAMQHLGMGGQYYDDMREPTKITINIDGREAFSKFISEAEYQTMINFGGN